MKFAIGYQLADEGEESFVEVVRDYLPHIAEVYFPWLDLPSGRAALTRRRGYVDWQGQRRLEEDLRAIRQAGVGLDLLLNANCYGGDAVSQRLQNTVCSVLDHLAETLGGVEVVTTASPSVAHVVKQGYPQVNVRASVNMRLGTVQAMEAVADLFDGFHVQRDYNRDLSRLRHLKAWADTRGRQLLMLANSGCLAFCPGQTFHDNMVAHEQEIDETVNIMGWTPHVCWRNMTDRAKWVWLLQATWVRPEDLRHYDDLFPVVKLATRMHQRPRMVVDAYVRRSFHGNLLDLFEPGFGPALAPHVLDASRFPPEWFDRTSACLRNCHECAYCRGVLERLLTPDTAD